MSPDCFQLRPIKSPRLDDRGLQAAVVKLQQLTKGINRSGPIPPSTKVDELRSILRRGFAKGLSFEQSSAFKRRSNLLLWLYLEDLAEDKKRELIPPLSGEAVVSILGLSGVASRPDLRRLATQLYFAHFDRTRLPCLEWLAQWLRQAWSSADSSRLDEDGLAWKKHAAEFFCLNAPANVAKHWAPGMTSQSLLQFFRIPEEGLFAAQVYDALIMRRLRELPTNSSDASLNLLVTKEKDRTLRTGKLLGAAAVEIFIERSKSENHGAVPKAWTEQLVTYACDPRTPSSAEHHRWWGWATNEQRDMAIRALSWMSLQEFIGLLEKSLVGTPQGHQFPERRRLLEKLFEKGIVIDARLVIPLHIRTQLDQRTREIIRPSWLGGTQDMSFICLRCIDKVFLIEGTHSFSLRGFIGADAFPLQGYWDAPPQQYKVSDFRVPDWKCNIYQRHQGYHWKNEFLAQLRRRHIEWSL